MAGAGGTTTTTPLRLKDLLELDCDSCSAAGFRCYPRRLGESAAPVRRLLESPSLRRRSPSKLSHLSRSLSRRLSRRGGFWRRRDDDDDDDDEGAPSAAAPTATSAGCGSSTSEELETSSESSDNSSGRTSRRSRSESDSVFSSATDDSVHHHPSQAAAAGDEHEVAMKRVSKHVGSTSTSGSEADDKEQLSPVAVMDFPFDDDVDDEMTDAGVSCSPPPFSIARLQRRITHKIRRFGSHDELAPLTLEALLAATSDPDSPVADDDVPAQAQQMIQCRMEGTATPSTCTNSGHRRSAALPDEDDHLISLLMGTVSSAGLDDMSERLLVDFFVEMKHQRSKARAESELPLRAPVAGVLRRKAERVVDGKAVAEAARGWLVGTGGTERWGLNDVLNGGAAIVAEMERGRRWMQVGEEEREVGAVVAGMLVDELVDEVFGWTEIKC